MSTPRPTWAGVRLTARAPRVAIVIPDDKHWDFWFRTALHQAGQVWGGCSAAVIPLRDGVIAEALVTGVQAYDPDHIVALAVDDDVRYALRGESRPVPPRPGGYPDGFAWPPESLPRREVSDEGSLLARDQLRVVTPSFRQRLTDDVESRLVDQLHVPVRGGPLSAARPPRRQDVDPGVFLSCPASWSGPPAAAVADLAGAYEAPDPRAADGGDRLDDDARDRLAAWLLGEDSIDLPQALVRWPSAALSMPTAGRETAHELSRQGLAGVVSSRIPSPGLLVCGRTAQDAALARLWSLVHGRAWWFPWSADQLGARNHWRAQSAVDNRRAELHRDGERLLVVGADTQLATGGWPGFTDDADTRWKAPQIAVTPDELAWSGAPRALAVEDHYGMPALLPVVEAEGTLSCETPVPPALMTHPLLADRDDLQWCIDVTWNDGRTAPHRPLDARALLADDDAVARTWVRPSRAGLSYSSHDYGLQLGGVLPVNRLAQPRLVIPGLDRWLRSAAAERGLDLLPSEAGRRARLLAERCGSREAYVDLFSGPLLPAMQKLANARGTTSRAFTRGHGVCLDTGAVMSWLGLQHLWTADADALRGVVDAACCAEVLRRGLVLQCGVCTEVQFLRLEQLAQRWTCQRCDQVQHLQLSAWRDPADEPMWFYDLHPVARRTVGEHGDVVALLDAHLRRSAATARSSITTVEEVELLDGRKRLAEVDLVAYDGVLRVAECKSSITKLPSVSEIAKKCLVADLVQADALVFATTEQEWPEGFHRRAVGEVHRYEWSARGAPALRLISALAHDSTQPLDLQL